MNEDQKNIELRHAEDHQVEVRVDEKTGKSKLTGFAVVYDKPSRVMVDPKTNRQFIEVIKPGAFAKTLADQSEVKADIGHGREAVIGRRSKGTLTLEDRAEGLHVEIDPPANTLGNDAIEAVRHGDTDGMSFQFRVRSGGESWAQAVINGVKIWVRTLTDLLLERVSLTSEPAYPDTSVALRSLEAAEKSEVEQEQSKEELKNKEAAIESPSLKWFESRAKAARAKATKDN